MDTILIKENLKNYYNQEAELRNSNTIKPDWKIEVREKFCSLIKKENKKTLLELGAGPGYDSQFFMNNGLTVTAIDISSEMVKNCKDKGIDAYELDFYNLSSLGKRFDCIYAMNTILHVPKDDLPHVLNEINSVLEVNGLFYMGLYGGQDIEKEHIISEVSDAPRFFVFNSKSYLEIVLEKHFQIISFESLYTDKINTHGDIDTFHSITMQKK